MVPRKHPHPLWGEVETVFNDCASSLSDWPMEKSHRERVPAPSCRPLNAIVTSWSLWTPVVTPQLTSALSWRAGALQWWPWSRLEPRRASLALPPPPAPPSLPLPLHRWVSLEGLTSPLTLTSLASPAPWWMMDSCASTPPSPNSQSAKSARCPFDTDRRWSFPFQRRKQKKNKNNVGFHKQTVYDCLYYVVFNMLIL